MFKSYSETVRFWTKSCNVACLLHGIEENITTMKQKVKFSNTVKVITSGILLMFLFLCGIGVKNCIQEGTILLPEVLGISVVLLSTLCTIYFMPRYVELTDDNVLVSHCVGYKVEIPVENISSVDVCDDFSHYKTLRTLGSGGFFGFLGRYYSPKHGRFTSFIGSSRDSFFVTLHSGKLYLFSCENREKLIELLNQRISK